MRLAKYIDGKIYAGEDLRPLIEDFTGVQLVDLPTVPPPPKRVDYDSPGDFMNAWNDHVVNYVKPYQAAQAEREYQAALFAAILADAFVCVAKIRSGYKLKEPPKGFFLAVAKKLTQLYTPNSTPLIDRICNENF